MKLDTIDAIARDICAMRGDSGNATYPIVARAAKRVIEQLNLHLFPNLVTKPMTVSSKLTIDLNPKEVEFVSKVGAAINKRIIPLPYISDLVSKDQLNYIQNEFPQCLCPTEPEETSSEESKTCVYCTFHNVYGDYNTYYAEYYGYRHLNVDNGGWNYDLKTNTIVLSGGYFVKDGGELMVEYKPCLQTESFKQVPSKYFPVIFQRVSQWLEQGTNVSAASFAKMEFLAEYDEIKSLDQNYSMDDIVGAMQSGYAYTIKQ